MSKTEVEVRTAEVTVRSLRITRSLIKQFRVLRSIPLEWMDQGKIIAKYVVGWLDGSVREGDCSRYLLLQKDGDCYLHGYYMIGSNSYIPPCKQIYVS